MAVSSGLWLFPEHCWYAWLLIGGMSKTVSVEANVAPNLLAKITSRIWKAPERFPTVNSFLKDFRGDSAGNNQTDGIDLSLNPDLFLYALLQVAAASKKSWSVK